MPVYAREVFGSAVSLGIMLGGFGAGALMSTHLFRAVGHRMPRRLTFVVCFVLVPTLTYLSLVLSPPLVVLVAALSLAGLIAGPINPIYASVFQERVPKEMRGRVFGVLNALAVGGVPLGMALAGFLIEVLGLVPTLLGMGSIYLAVTTSLFFNPALHEMKKPAVANGGEDGSEGGTPGVRIEDAAG
jgi:MFS family permease